MKGHCALCMQRLLSGLLIFAICLSMLPTFAYADEQLPDEVSTEFAEPEETATEQSYSVLFAYDDSAPVNAPEVMPESEFLPGDRVSLEEPALDGYVFEGWQQDGIPVHESFVMPEDDVELVGTWSDYMPADEIIGRVYDGIVASASWDDCVFPEGTELQITPESRETATGIAELAFAGELEVADAVAMDISFSSSTGEELQPYDGGEVHVELTLPEAIVGESFYLIHVMDDGRFEFLPDVIITAEQMENGLLQAKQISFDTCSFSVYVVASTGDLDRYNRRTYEYYADGQLVFRQTVTVEDPLLDPAKIRSFKKFKKFMVNFA